MGRLLCWRLSIALTGVVSLLLAATWAYWPAIAGPFLFDDFASLNSLSAFSDGVGLTALRDYLISGAAGPGGRPISLLSFLINDMAWPSQPASFKYTNLMVHLLNGCLLAWLLMRLAARLPGGLTDIRLATLYFIVAFWLLNPYHVSAVMYVVQRMALLAATFVLAGLVFYLVGRERLERGQAWQGYLLIWSGYLIGAGLGAFSKENAALFVLMVPLIEGLCFAKEDRVPAAWLLMLTVALPALLLIMAIAFRWPSFAEQYQTFRDFTLGERLLSQFRALGYYLWRYLLPGVGYVGIYADGFEKSVSLFQPVSTLLWMLVHCALIVVAVSVRRRWPMLTLGVSLYYVAHLLESSIVPLEIFFEHRNYLPSAFLLLGLMHCSVLSRRWTIFALAILLACLSLLRLQAGYWGSEPLLKAVMMVENPSSERAVLDYVSYLEREGRQVETLNVLREYARQYPAGIEVGVNTMVVACSLRQDTPEDVDLLLGSPGKYRGKAPFVVERVMELVRLQVVGRCQTLTMDHLDEFLDLYLQAFPRDAMANQAYHVSKAYVQLFRGSYTGFVREAETAMSIWPNRELVLGLCWQMHEVGASADSCNCFNSQAELFDTVSNTNNSVMRSIGGYSLKLKAEFLLKKSKVCNVGKSGEPDQSEDFQADASR